MIKEIYSARRHEIEKRLKEFKEVKTDREIFCELAFCLLTPQSKAKVCWDAIENLVKKDVMWDGNEEEVCNELKGVRFKNKKARFICEARRVFLIMELGRGTGS